MNIVIDAFGGDNAPLEVIRGAVDANRDFNIDITLVGDENTIKKCAKENALDISALKIKHADSVIDVCEEPTNVIKSKKDCSMAVGMQMLADGEGDCFCFSRVNGCADGWRNIYCKATERHQASPLLLLYCLLHLLRLCFLTVELMLTVVLKCWYSSLLWVLHI